MTSRTQPSGKVEYRMDIYWRISPDHDTCFYIDLWEDNILQGCKESNMEPKEVRKIVRALRGIAGIYEQKGYQMYLRVNGAVISLEESDSNVSERILRQVSINPYFLNKRKEIIESES